MASLPCVMLVLLLAGCTTPASAPTWDYPHDCPLENRRDCAQDAQVLEPERQPEYLVCLSRIELNAETRIELQYEPISGKKGLAYHRQGTGSLGTAILHLGNNSTQSLLTWNETGESQFIWLPSGLDSEFDFFLLVGKFTYILEFPSAAHAQPLWFWNQSLEVVHRVDTGSSPIFFQRWINTPSGPSTLEPFAEESEHWTFKVQSTKWIQGGGRFGTDLACNRL